MGSGPSREDSEAGPGNAPERNTDKGGRSTSTGVPSGVNTSTVTSRRPNKRRPGHRPAADARVHVPEIKPLNPEEIEEATAVKCLRIDFKFNQNSKEHHTDDFETSKQWENDNNEVQQPYLIVRRGQDIVMDLHMDKEFNKEHHNMRFCFEIGDMPKAGDGTKVSFKVSKKDEPKKWGAEILSIQGKVVTVSIITPPTCMIGKWKLHVDMIVKKKSGPFALDRFTNPQGFYVLFNPWCPDDQVYMEDTKLLNEYIRNDSGKIYRGTKNHIGFKQWNFGQFEDFVLDCCLYLLDLSEIEYKLRGNPVLIARKISGIVNKSDISDKDPDSGVLVGNWSGDYKDGTRPTAWVGSVAILREFWKNKKPVLFGQCWVFSGVVTTVARCLGIPARSVTNFNSAHDTDGSFTIDKYLYSDGEPIDYLNSDSIWNFHVWNDVWMARPDLPEGYGGWQAIDATPQETSDGSFQAGPSPLKAIKEGNTYMPYDTLFIMAEVNGDKCTFQEKPQEESFGMFGPLYVEKEYDVTIKKNVVGHRILTKKPCTEIDEANNAVSHHMHDITKQYKYPEGSEEERAAILRAVGNTTNEITGRRVYDAEMEKQDVKLMWKDFSPKLGEPFTATLLMCNNSQEERTIMLNLSASVVFNTGDYKKHLVAEKSTIKLAPNEQDKEATLTVSPDQYMAHILDDTQMMSMANGKVLENSQVCAEEDIFTLEPPELKIERDGDEDIQVGKSFKLKVSFTNPLPMALTKCVFSVDAAGLKKFNALKIKDVPPGKEAAALLDLTPKRARSINVCISFDCAEPIDVTGNLMITAKEKMKNEN